MKNLKPLNVRKPVREVRRSDGSIKIYGWTEDDELCTVVMIRSDRGYDINEIKVGGQIRFYDGKKVEYPNPYDDPKFRRFVLVHCIDVPTETTEPFCPFEGIYCNCAYSARCLKCQEALEAYNKH